MNQPLNRCLGRTLLGIACCATLPAALADTLDFENLSGPVLDGDSLNLGNYLITGMSYDPAPGSLVGALIDGSNPGACQSVVCAQNNPTTYYAALNDGIVDIRHATGGQAFQLKSFDASFISGVNDGFQPIAGFVRVQGFRADNSSVYEDFLLPGRDFGVNGYDFTHFTTSSAFSQQQFVEVAMFGFGCNFWGQCSAFDKLSGQYGLDNVELAVSAVPEPSSWMTLGGGLLGLGLLARRRAAVRVTVRTGGQA